MANILRKYIFVDVLRLEKQKQTKNKQKQNKNKNRRKKSQQMPEMWSGESRVFW